MSVPPSGYLEIPTSGAFVTATGPILYTQFRIPGGLGIPISTVPPAITGTATVGQTLTCSTGTWTYAPTSFAYQWYNEGSAIGGATSATYALLAADLGALITCAVMAANGAGASSAAFSGLAGPVISPTSYYVANAGSDGNSGTDSAHPWQTVAKVNGFAFAAGTSVRFNRGDVWREQLKPTASGSAGNPIVLDAYGTGANPILQGSVAASTTGDWDNISGNIWKQPCVQV
ncbi:MAG: hypothetical protein ACREC4_02795 [Methylocella sp.]